jgi:hypothetical protein
VDEVAYSCLWKMPLVVLRLFLEVDGSWDAVLDLQLRELKD